MSIYPAPYTILLASYKNQCDLIWKIIAFHANFQIFSAVLVSPITIICYFIVFFLYFLAFHIQMFPEKKLMVSVSLIKIAKKIESCLD